MTTLNTDVVMELMWDEWELLLFGIMVFHHDSVWWSCRAFSRSGIVKEPTKYVGIK